MIWVLMIANAIAGGCVAGYWVMLARDRMDEWLRWMGCVWILGALVAVNTGAVMLGQAHAEIDSLRAAAEQTSR